MVRPAWPWDLYPPCGSAGYQIASTTRGTMGRFVRPSDRRRDQVDRDFSMMTFAKCAFKPYTACSLVSRLRDGVTAAALVTMSSLVKDGIVFLRFCGVIFRSWNSDFQEKCLCPCVLYLRLLPPSLRFVFVMSVNDESRQCFSSHTPE